MPKGVEVQVLSRALGKFYKSMQKEQRLQGSDGQNITFSAYLDLLRMQDSFTELTFAVLVEIMNRQLLNIGYTQEQIDRALEESGQTIDWKEINRTLSSVG